MLQELNDRDKFLQVLLEKYQQANQPPADAAGSSSTGSGSSKQAGGNAVTSGPPLLPDEALAVILRNERGRQVWGQAATWLKECWARQLHRAHAAAVEPSCCNVYVMLLLSRHVS